MHESGLQREVELKLLVPESELPRVRRHPRLRALTRGRAETRHLVSTYYDTPDLDLAGLGVALRVRRDGESLVQTVKTRGDSSAGLFARGEWESPLAAAQPDLALIGDAALRAQLLERVGAKPLDPVVETHVQRTLRRLAEADWEVDCALDVGEIRADGRSAPVCELELELVRGEPVVLYELALALHETIPLRPAVRDKLERGFALRRGEEPAPRRARRPLLAPDSSVDDALAAVLASALEQVLANEEPARRGLDPEGVHQMRVGVRRLRSAFAVFRRVVPDDHATAFREELRWLAGELGAARDLDVFVEETLAPVARHLADDPALKRLRDAALEMRAEAYEGVRRALASRRWSGLALGLGAWLAARGWRDQSLTPSSARLFAPARALASARLSRRLKKARQLGRHLEDRTLAEKHQLRIALKKLRYAVEFFRGLYGEPARSERLVRRLARLQDVLGHLNDQASADGLLDAIVVRLGPEANAAHHRAAGVVSGWIAHDVERRMRRLEREWRRFLKTEPFWV